MDEPHQDRQFATTLARGLDVLQCFSVDDSTLGNKQISERTGLPKATVSRLTYTLTKLGYLKFVPGLGKHGRYALGSALVSITHPLLANLRLRQVARASMNTLAQASGGCVSISMRERADMVRIESAMPRGQAPLQYDIGHTFPITGSLIGAAYLARLSERDRASVLAESDATPIKRSHADRLWFEKKITEHGERGFCVDTRKQETREYTVAAAMQWPKGGEVFVFSCAVPVEQRSGATLANDLGLKIVQLAREAEESADGNAHRPPRTDLR